MKRNAMWLVPGLVSVIVVSWTPACSSSDDTDLSGSTPDAGSSPADGSTPRADASSGDDGGSPVVDSGKSDAKVDAGPVDPYVEACARIDACATPTAPRIGMNGCYSLLTAAPLARQLDPKERAQLENLACKLAAKTCTDVRACDRPNADYVAFCQQKEGGEHCDGNVHVVCDPNTFEPVLAVDCAASSMICGQNGPVAGCGIATCTPGETLPKCNGDMLTECSSAGVTQAVDCKTANVVISVRTPSGGKKYTIAGTTCGIDNKDFAGQDNCIGTGVACTAFAQRCDGTVLETCAGGYVARRDCAKLLPAGQGCLELEDGPAAGTYGCGPINPPCHETDDETCNASTGEIGFCALTAKKTLDCKALGYAGCKTTTVEGRVTAACFQ